MIIHEIVYDKDSKKWSMDIRSKKGSGEDFSISETLASQLIDTFELTKETVAGSLIVYSEK